MLFDPASFVNLSEESTIQSFKDIFLTIPACVVIPTLWLSELIPNCGQVLCPVPLWCPKMFPMASVSMAATPTHSTKSNLSYMINCSQVSASYLLNSVKKNT
ncbi:unnamed protein product [Lota lota]